MMGSLCGFSRLFFRDLQPYKRTNLVEQNLERFLLWILTIKTSIPTALLVEGEENLSCVERIFTHWWCLITNRYRTSKGVS